MHVLAKGSLAVLVLEIVTEHLFYQAISVFWVVHRLDMLQTTRLPPGTSTLEEIHTVIAVRYGLVV